MTRFFAGSNSAKRTRPLDSCKITSPSPPSHFEGYSQRSSWICGISPSARPCTKWEEVNMKLVSYNAGSGPRAGVLLEDDRIADVSTLLGTRESLRDVQALLEQPDRPMDRLRDLLAKRPPV